MKKEGEGRIPSPMVVHSNVLYVGITMDSYCCYCCNNSNSNYVQYSRLWILVAMLKKIYWLSLHKQA